MTKSAIFKRHSFRSWDLPVQEETEIFTGSQDKNGVDYTYDVKSTGTEDDVIFACVTGALTVATLGPSISSIFFLLGLCEAASRSNDREDRRNIME
ncbi:hypothetical protein ACOMHN_056368 [Nucella lapillus]